MHHLISVIVPIYKVESYLRRCLDSIVNQTYTNLEIILVDDGSPDKCPAICDEYAKKDERIIVIHKKNGGLSDARNAAIDISKGEYLAFIDSDDWVSSDYIEILLRNAIQEKADISITSFKEVTEDSPVQSSNNFSKIEIFNNQELLNQLCLGKHKELMSVWGKIFKRECFKNIRFPVGKLYEDARTNYKIYYSIKKACLVKKVTYFYLLRPSGIMGQTKSAISVLDAMIDRYHFCKQKKEELAAEFCTISLSWDLLFLYSIKNKHDSTCFKNMDELSLFFKEIKKDFFKLPFRYKLKNTFLWIFLKIPYLYILYRKYSPMHIRKN